MFSPHLLPLFILYRKLEKSQPLYFKIFPISKHELIFVQFDLIYFSIYTELDKKLWISCG
nr:MAG TPA: hypothetical protein [Caudoviricetes sp.]